MKILIDTQVFLWWISDNPNISSKFHDVMSEPRNEIYFSAASGWEIAVKAKIGRLSIQGDPQKFIPTQLSLNSITVLPIQISHTLQTYHLPEHHKDPFDRLIIAQSQIENMPIATNDALFKNYEVDLIW